MTARVFRAALLGTCLLLFGNLARAGELTVYSALEEDQLESYGAAFNAVHPDIVITWVRDSSGSVTQKFLAEKDEPQADVIWGLAATSLLLFKQEGLLEAYAPSGLERLDPLMRDADQPPTWVGMDAWAAVICYNTLEGERLGLTAPASWADLTKPLYRGHIVMPNPNSSGTGFLDLSSWVQIMGETAAWSFMDALHQNVASYSRSGAKPCRLAAAGETAIGISFDYRAAKAKAEGAPIDIILPSEGIGWDMEAAAIVAGTDNIEDAKKLMDWAIGDEAMTLYNQSYSVLAVPSLAKPVEYLPEGLREKMIANDFEWAAANRARLLEEWLARYDDKSEPQN